MYHIISGPVTLSSSGRSHLALSLLWLVVMVILASYSGTLTAYLAVDLKSLPFSSINQAIQSSSHKIWATPTSAFVELLSVCTFPVIYFDIIVLFPFRISEISTHSMYCFFIGHILSQLINFREIVLDRTRVRTFFLVFGRELWRTLKTQSQLKDTMEQYSSF